MAKKEKVTKQELEVQEIVSRSEQFIENNKKNIFYGAIVLALVIGGIMAVRHGYMIPREKKATAVLFKGEQYFARDSFNLALNGNGADFPGFVSIINEFGSTESGNLAKAYAGVCYFRTGENQKAIEMLKSFKGKDTMISPALTGLIGDCYINAGNVKEGISFFEKAARSANNEVVSPVYLKKAAIAYESLNQYNDAVKLYTSIKEQYTASTEAADIDKYIARANALAKN